MKKQIKAIAFDVFGTLVEIQDKRRPFAKLLNIAKPRLGYYQVIDAEYIMSHNVDLRATSKLLNTNISEAELKSLEDSLAHEVSTIQLFSDVTAVLRYLRFQGYRIGLCSNLAAPYGPPVEGLLPFELDHYTWSYTAGAVKPQPKIYEHLCEGLGCSPSEIMFIGDTYEDDFKGPVEFGMSAKHLVRGARMRNLDTINTLHEITKLL